MAAADVINQTTLDRHVDGKLHTTVDRPLGQHNVQTVMNYYDDPGDGTPPAPFYVEYVATLLLYALCYLEHADKYQSRIGCLSYSRPYDEQAKARPTVAVQVEVTDISGNEDKYTLDGNGFQIVQHESKEKDFLDEERIKSIYYPETEQLLKDV